MGGGGGGGPGDIPDLKDLVDKAKQELREGKRNVFISFDYDDLDEVNLLRGQAKNDNVPLEFNDWSVSEAFDSERAAYIKQKISERIAQSSVTVVYLSDATPKSSWVDWEIKESLRQGKYVLGVYPKGSKPGKLPTEIEKNGIKCVTWSKLALTIDKLK